MYINAYKKYQVKYSCLSKYLAVDGTLKEIKKETSNKEKAYSELYEKIEYNIELERKISEELKDE